MRAEHSTYKKTFYCLKEAINWMCKTPLYCFLLNADRYEFWPIGLKKSLWVKHYRTYSLADFFQMCVIYFKTVIWAFIKKMRWLKIQPGLKLISISNNSAYHSSPAEKFILPNHSPQSEDEGTSQEWRRMTEKGKKMQNQKRWQGDR